MSYVQAHVAFFSLIIASSRVHGRKVGHSLVCQQRSHFSAELPKFLGLEKTWRPHLSNASGLTGKKETVLLFRLFTCTDLSRRCASLCFIKGCVHTCQRYRREGVTFKKKDIQYKHSGGMIPVAQTHSPAACLISTYQGSRFVAEKNIIPRKSPKSNATSPHSYYSGCKNLN